jgi:NADPH2:quinone reductase
MVGSHSVIGFWLVDCMRTDPIHLVAEPLRELVSMVESGVLTPLEGPTYPLADAATAHRDMRERRTSGKVILTAP